MIPTPAQLALAQSNFIDKLAEYFNEKKYSLTVCRDCVDDAYILLKYAQQSCDIPYEAYCALDNLADNCIDCSGDPSCADLLTISSTKRVYGGTYTSTFSNELDTTPYPYIDVTSDTIYQIAKGSLIVSRDGSVELSEEVTTGDYYNGTSVLSGNAYHVSASTAFLFRIPQANHATMYIQSLRLSNYSNGVITYQDIDVSPSNIWTCGTCVAVSPSDLYVASVNFETALATQILNAVKALDNAPNIEVVVRKVSLANSEIAIQIETKIKHLPSFSWWGLDKNNLRAVIYGPKPTQFIHKTQVDNVLADGVVISPGSIYYQTNFVTTCGTTTLTIQQGAITPQMSSVANFFYFGLYTPICTTVVTNPPVTVSGTIPPCSVVTLYSHINTALPYTLQWKNPSSVVIGTTSSIILTNPTSGTYSVTATYSGGNCTNTSEITI